MSVGGVIAIFDYVNLIINNGSFTNNYAGLGGVISGQYNVTLDISNSAFNDNSGIFIFIFVLIFEICKFHFRSSSGFIWWRNLFNA